METTDKEESLMALMSNLKNSFPTNQVDKDNQEKRGEGVPTKVCIISIQSSFNVEKAPEEFP